MYKEAIEGLNPEILWKRFYEISQNPRPSKNEEKIREYIRSFAKEHSLKFDEDKTGNVVIILPASEGYENAPTIVLQGHVDMVCEKNKTTKHDFDKDPIKLIRDSDWMKADGTTLGSDNGIGVAAALATVTDKDVVHGPLELLFTVDEETGLTGAFNLKPGFISGKILINMDSEEDGTFYIGCSGGQDTLGIFNIQATKVKKGYTPYELIITGLKGGHSGLDVQNGRANAIQLLARLLERMSAINYRIVDINGGSKRNAIPREAEVTLLLKPKSKKKVKSIINQFVEDTLLEYKSTDGGLEIILKKKDVKVKKIFRKSFSRKILNVLLSLPHGIMAMNPDIPGLVETSTNLATIFTEGKKIRIGTSQRSSIESAKVNISNNVKAVFQLAGADKIEVSDGYPGWIPNLDSEALKISKDVFKELYNKEPEIKAIHAGLECGILGAKYPGLDMISFGPTIQGAHSPDERVNIKDVEKFYTLLKGLLLRFAK